MALDPDHKEGSLNLCLMARGSQAAGFTQPRAHIIVSHRNHDVAAAVGARARVLHVDERLHVGIRARLGAGVGRHHSRVESQAEDEH